MDIAKHLFKPKYTIKKTGEIKEARFWYVRIAGRRYPLRTTDISVAEKRARILKRQLDTGEDIHAVENARHESIENHLKAFEESQVAKGCCEEYVEMLMGRIRRVFNACRIYRLADVQGYRIDEWLCRQQTNSKRFSAQTRKHYTVNLRQFGNFLLSRNLVYQNPFKGLQSKFNVEGDRRIRRRYLSIDELRTLLESVRKSKWRRGGLAGPERRLLYWMASVTGLRRRELASLTVESFDFDGPEPSVTVIATRTKNRKTAILPLRSDLVAELKPWLSKRKPGTILFPIEKGRMYDVIRADMKEAGLINEKNGKRVDFHALRVTMISHLGINGVSVQVAQKLARHSTPILTANIYTQLEIGDLQKAVEQLPSICTAPAVDQSDGISGS